MGIEIVRDVKLSIEEKAVLRLQGYRGDAMPEAYIYQALKSQIKDGYSLIYTKAAYTLMKIEDATSTRLRLAEGVTLNPAEAMETWTGSGYLAIVLCTIGPELEHRVASLFAQEEYAPALMLDSVGSVAAEALADYVNYIVCRKAKELGLMAGPRASPGYGRWPLSDQRLLLNCLPAETIGVRLTEHYMMVPKKSVSFCAGVGKNLPTKATSLPCRRCGMTSCQYRTQN